MTTFGYSVCTDCKGHGITRADGTPFDDGGQCDCQHAPDCCNCTLCDLCDGDGEVLADIPAITPTDELIDRFAAALKEKLNQAREKYGYQAEQWSYTKFIAGMRESLYEHLAKGDPRDVAAYAAFLWHHNESTASKHAEDDYLSILAGQCWDLRCIDIPTGGDDSDIAWIVIEHHMAKPHERQIGHGRTPKEAIDAALLISDEIRDDVEGAAP